MDQIVVGIDPEPAGRRALQWALGEAIALGLPLKAVRAWQVVAAGPSFPAGGALLADRSVAADEAQHLAEVMLKEAREQVTGSDAVRTTADAVLGVPGQVLVDTAGEQSLLVVGSRGAGALSRAVLGSVSAAALHHARCPVVVVPEQASVPVGTARVLVGVDHSPQSREALRVGIRLAAAHGAVLVPLFVHDPHASTGLGDLATLEASERAALRAAAIAEGAGELVLEPDVLSGQAAAELRRAVRPGDVLVVGSRGRGGFASLLLGSTSSQLAQHAAAPVVVVHGT